MHCNKNKNCTKRQYKRCYNPENCSGVWAAIGRVSDCSASCGEGTKAQDEVCQEIDGSGIFDSDF